MSDMLAVLVYLLAIGLPLYLLYQFRPRAWYWHSLAVVAAMSFGFIPIPAQLQNPASDMVFGCVFIALLIWGLCGLLLLHTHFEKHA
jgi:hypothetical protein